MHIVITRKGLIVAMNHHPLMHPLMRLNRIDKAKCKRGLAILNLKIQLSKHPFNYSYCL